MDQHFFKVPFADGGDTAVIPEAPQVDGSVSYTDGFGPDYALDPATDPAAKLIPRDKSNGLYNSITEALQQYQVFGTPEWITSANNGGSPYSYSKGATVRYDAGGGVWSVWESIVDANTATPNTDITKWRRVNATTSSATATASYTYVVADDRLVRLRSNAAALMTDTLPGTGTAVMPAGWSVTVRNTDVSALLRIVSAAGATLNGSATGSVILGPGQTATIFSDGSNYTSSVNPGRTRLGAPLTLYVNAAGANDPSHGLTNGAGSFATIAYAVAWAQTNLDLNGFVLTVSCNAGAYNTPIVIFGGFVGGSGISGAALFLAGNGSTVTTTAGFDCLTVGAGAYVNISGFTFTTALGSSANITAGNGGRVDLGASMVFGQGGNNGQMYAFCGGFIYLASSYTITGGSPIHWYSNQGGQIVCPGGITITLTGTPAFSQAFAIASQVSGIQLTSSITFVGAATGTRYVAQLVSNISVGGGGANYLPGNSAGTTLQGGNYG